jgi:hypothetical protein
MNIATLEKRLSLLENPDVIALLRMVSAEFIDNKNVKEIKDSLEKSLKNDISLEMEKIHKNQYKLWV